LNFIHYKWCPRPDSNWHSASGKDFKSTDKLKSFDLLNLIIYASIQAWHQCT